MKELFNIMVKTSLENYFVEKIIPESLKYELRDGRKTDIGLSHREHLGLVILSFLLRWLNYKKIYVPAINKQYDDGAISNIDTNEFYPVEQVYIYEEKWDNKIVQGIKKDALNKKNEKGSEYASGSILLVFCNAVGDLNPNSIKNELKKSFFKSVLIVGPSGKGKYDYNIILAKENNEISNRHLELSINSSNGKCKIN